MTLKQFEKTLDQQLIEGLALLGFSNPQKHRYEKDLGEDKSGSILIEKTDRRTKQTWFVSAKVLFAHKAVEELTQEVAPDFYSADRIINTVSQGLGYLTPKREYRTWDFTIGEDESTTKVTMSDLLRTILDYAVPTLDRLCDDQELLRVMNSNEIGLQITNQVKAPTLQFLMGQKDEAKELAGQTLSKVRPTPKVTNSEEPISFNSPEEAFSFFRRDKDPRYYYFYRRFCERFLLKG